MSKTTLSQRQVRQIIKEEMDAVLSEKEIKESAAVAIGLMFSGVQDLENAGVEGLLVDTEKGTVIVDMDGLEKTAEDIKNMKDIDLTGNGEIDLKQKDVAKEFADMLKMAKNQAKWGGQSTNLKIDIDGDGKKDDVVTSATNSSSGFDFDINLDTARVSQMDDFWLGKILLSHSSPVPEATPDAPSIDKDLEPGMQQYDFTKNPAASAAHNLTNIYTGKDVEKSKKNLKDLQNSGQVDQLEGVNIDNLGQGDKETRQLAADISSSSPDQSKSSGSSEGGSEKGSSPFQKFKKWLKK